MTLETGRHLLARDARIPALGATAPIHGGVLVAALVLLCGSFGLLALPEATVLALGEEDGWIEAIGAIAFLAAGVLYARAAFACGRHDSSRGARPWLLVLALAFLFAGAEEISWGQRLIGWETPPGIEAINSQGETTIHNLAIFQEDQRFDFYLLFNLFWLAYCLALPLGARVEPIAGLARRLRVPVPPLWSGGLLLATYVTFKFTAIQFPHGGEVRHVANELKETNSAVVILLLAAWELRRVRRTTEATEDA